MFKTRPCGCKGLRSCKICEVKYGAFQVFSDISKENSYAYCHQCKKLWPGWEASVYRDHPSHMGESVSFSGIEIIQDFVTEEEERELIENIDKIPWDVSQSGRLKQNYGPKCNFKKRKVTLGSFQGYPICTKFLQERFKTLPLLESFETVEQCSLEYTPDRGSSIDPHIDDCWIWGERIPTVSFLSDSVLTLLKFTGQKSKYNLCDAENYPRLVSSNGSVKNSDDIRKDLDAILSRDTENIPEIPEGTESGIPNITVIRVPMPRRSLLVLYGNARYDFEHAILREDIKERRVCITYREITPTFMSFGHHATVGREILQRAKLFWDGETS